MAVPSSAAIIAALHDSALRERAQALAPLAGLTPDEVAVRWSQLVLAAVDDTGDNNIASVYDYAATVRRQALAQVPPEPGVDPAVVTDTHLLHAMRTLTNPGE